MNQKIYRRIAKKHGVTVTKVKQDIAEAINATYNNPNPSSINIKAQNAIVRKGEIPTPNEFIEYLAAEVKKKKQIGGL